jgi:CubicO group peptidase (beta-lactamase class C family)
MAHTEFIPDDRSNLIPSIDDPTLLGSPLDANARLLGGVAGNCGLFGCLNDLTKYADMLLSEGAPLMSREIFLQGRSVRTPGMREARGYGFLFIDETYPHTGALFPAGSFGHIAFTGQSLFVDPASGRYVIVLSDSALATERKYGHVISSEVVALRRSIHEAILADLSE